jgi:hypothetical protein
MVFSPWWHVRWQRPVFDDDGVDEKAAADNALQSGVQKTRAYARVPHPANALFLLTLFICCMTLC